jgi:hypothetical protein
MCKVRASGPDTPLANELGRDRRYRRQTSLRRLDLLMPQPGRARQLCFLDAHLAHDTADDRHRVLQILWHDARTDHHTHHGYAKDVTLDSSLSGKPSDYCFIEAFNHIVIGYNVPIAIHDSGGAASPSP